MTLAQGFPASERMIIGLIGPCGSGKSTLSAAFAALPGVDVAMEIPPKALEGNSAYINLDVAALQREFLEARLRQVKAARSSFLVLDRTVEEDRNVFLRLHHELGGLTSLELRQLDKLAEQMGKTIGTPDAFVILQADPEVLRRRIARSSRPDWLVSSFDRQLALYEALISNTEGIIVKIDTTVSSADDLGRVASWIVETVPFAKAHAPVETLNCSTSALAWVVH